MNKMSEKICIVNGANSGVEKETVKQLVNLDSHVIMVLSCYNELLSR